MITALDKNTALVLIDLQNSTLSAAGIHSIETILNNSNKLIAAFRKKNLPVVIVNVKPGDAAWMKSRKEVKMPAYPDDENMYKIRISLMQAAAIFLLPNIHGMLFLKRLCMMNYKTKNITGIVFGGVSTSIGVEGTARAASELGYNISFALDAITDRAQEAHDRSVQFIFPRLGETGSTNDIIKMIN